jgi:hypothetical protein
LKIVTGWRIAFITGLTVCVVALTFASSAPSIALAGSRPGGLRSTIHRPYRPWVEGVDPIKENRLFYATYGALSSHNVLKVYVFSTAGYESAGIRFSARVPHESRDLTLAELSRETVTLIRTTFDEFPEIQHVDIWATVPVAQAQQTSVENTVFSVSSDRGDYEHVAMQTQVTDLGFLSAFGRIWIAPQVPR